MCILEYGTKWVNNAWIYCGIRMRTVYLGHHFHKKNHMKRAVFRLLIISVLCLAVPSLASAATYSAGERYTLDAPEAIDGNLYVGGSNVTVAGTVNGDTIVGGANVVLSGTFEDDVFVAGGTVTVSGTINDDLRVGSGTVIISGTVNGDVNAGSGTITIEKGALITGDCIVGTGSLTLAGTVRQNLAVAAGEATISGTVGGDVEARLKTLTITKDAAVSGNVTYYSDTQGSIAPEAKITGNVSWNQTTAGWQKLDLYGIGAMGFIINLIGSLIATFLCIFVFKKFSEAVAIKTKNDFGTSLVYGLIMTIVFPIASILLLLTVIGIPLGIIGLSIAALLMLFGALYANIAVGGFIFRLFSKNAQQTQITWQIVLIGCLIQNALLLVPVIGWAVSFVFFLTGIGSFSMVLYSLLVPKKTLPNQP